MGDSQVPVVHVYQFTDVHWRFVARNRPICDLPGGLPFYVASKVSEVTCSECLDLLAPYAIYIWLWWLVTGRRT